MSRLEHTGKSFLRFIGKTRPFGDLPVARQELADFRSVQNPLRHITSGAVMPKSAKALASVCLVAATRRSRAALT